MVKLFLIATSVMLVVAPLRNGHPDRASLGGRVTDEDRLAVASATVSARNIFSGESEYTTTGTGGFYKFDAMKQGRYSVFVEAEGYGTTWVPTVFLVRGQHTELDITLARSRKDRRPPG